MATVLLTLVGEMPNIFCVIFTTNKFAMFVVDKVFVILNERKDKKCLN